MQPSGCDRQAGGFDQASDGATETAHRDQADPGLEKRRLEAKSRRGEAKRGRGPVGE